MPAGRNVVFAWGMGMTHHLHGVENVEAIANLALLRGMIGKRFAGLLPLRGHSNVQGIGTIGVKPVVSDPSLRRHGAVASASTSAAPKGYDTMAGLEAARARRDRCRRHHGREPLGRDARHGLRHPRHGAIGFKLFLTTTLNRGHVHGLGEGEVLILPVTARDEEWSPTTQESMFNYVRLSAMAASSALSNVRPETVILSDLAAAACCRTRRSRSSEFKEHRRSPRSRLRKSSPAWSSSPISTWPSASSTSATA